MKPPDQGAQAYLVVAPDGDHIEIPKELFVALSDFLRGGGPSGSVVIHFRNGGIAGLDEVGNVDDKNGVGLTLEGDYA